MTAKKQIATKPANQVPADPAAGVLAVIERAANNPEVDIDKMERLLVMQEKILNKQAETTFNQAMATAQSEMRPIAADAENPQTRSKYASYKALDNALRPVYTAHGFALSFNTADSPQDKYIRVLCYVSHQAGFSRTYHVDMPADGLGAKGGQVMTKTHAAGSAMTYGMRYLLKLIFNVAIGEDDDDGNLAGAVEFVTKAQAGTLAELLKISGANQGKFLGWLQAETMADIRASDFTRAEDALLQRIAKNDAEASE